MILTKATVMDNEGVGRAGGDRGNGAEADAHTANWGS